MRKEHTEIEKKVLAIIEQETAIVIENLDYNQELKTLISVDSIHLIGIIARLEQEFGIELPLSIIEAATPREFFTILESAIKDLS
ncbi:MAG: acyl carrier protein [Chitinivibrionales bacterium]|nr:acyl carrier protein [Chitinivibrionales bacterium]